VAIGRGNLVLGETGWREMCREKVQIKVNDRLLFKEKQGKPRNIVGDVEGR
jgi:hypothetical protein